MTSVSRKRKEPDDSEGSPEESREPSVDASNATWSYENAHGVRVWGVGKRLLPKYAEILRRVLPLVTREALAILENPPTTFRAIDWIVTNWCKRHSVVLYNPKKHMFPVVLSRAYEEMLRVHKKVLFDIFKRGERIYYTVDGVSQTTTVAQLNFLTWGVENDLFAYAADNREEITRDMSALTTEHQEKKRKTCARKRMSLCATKKDVITIASGVIVTTFEKRL